MSASQPAPEAAPEPESEPDPIEVLTDRRFVGVLVLAAIVGVVASVIAWGFLVLVHEVQHWVFADIPDVLGYDHTPLWFYLPVLALAGVVTALAITRLPGRGGHVPAHGLDPEPTHPGALPGVALAALASIGLGIVLGPEAPLIAIGGGLGYLAVRLLRRDAPEELGSLIAASGTFAAVSFLFGSPLVAAVILIEASGVGPRRMPVVLIPGLLAAGIGSLVSIGLGSWTGVDRADISFDQLPLPEFARPDFADFLWTVPLAAAVAIGAIAIFELARRAEPLTARRPLLVLPAFGLFIAALAIAFAGATDKGADQILFSGQEQIGPLISGAEDWSLGALALVIVLKGLAYSVSLAGFRGGPVFPALFIGAAAGLMAAQLPGFEATPAVAVCLGAAIAAVLRLPLSGVVLATVLTAHTGLGVTPLIIVGVVVAYLVSIRLKRPAAAAA